MTSRSGGRPVEILLAGDDQDDVVLTVGSEDGQGTQVEVTIPTT